MKSLTINGVNIRVHGDASVSVDSYGNVDVYVKPTYVTIQKPSPWPKPIYPSKHWLK